MCRMPRCDSASTTAFWTAGVDPIVPDSPIPLAPSGLFGLGVSVVAALALPFVLGRWSLMVAFGLWLGLWVVAASVAQFAQRLKAAPQATLAEITRNILSNRP